jgi:hypothetical protein
LDFAQDLWPKTPPGTSSVLLRLIDATKTGIATVDRLREAGLIMRFA